MASPKAPFPTNRFEGRRTNSLGFAKHDCHTCSSLRKCCDRRRPHCGTCKSSGRQCGGFAMELVWKDLAKVHAPCRPAKRSEHAEQLRKGPVREHIAFKFVPGTSKRQRNGNGAYRSAVAHPELNGIRPVFSVQPTRHGASPLPAPEANDEDARSVLSSSKSQGLRGDEASHGSQSHDDTRGSGHDGSPQTHEPGGDDDTSGLHVQVDAAASTFEYRPWLGCTDEATAVSEWYYISPCMRPPDDDDEAAPVEHGIELEVNMPPIYEVTNAQEPSDRSTGCDFSLDVGVRYQTLTEKYDQVLRMCK